MTQSDSALQVRRQLVVWLKLLTALAMVGATTMMSPASKLNAQCSTCPDICWDGCDELNGCPVGSTDWCQYVGGCPSGQWSSNNCCYMTPSPILIDPDGDGFALTNVPGGVQFAIGPTNLLYRVAWTQHDADDAWLVLDRNGNQRIDNGLELFGTFTEQPAPAPWEIKNGYRALAVFDRRENGGNRDGQITREDRVFSQLRLWRDSNQNGVSEPPELRSLTAYGLRAIDLDYRESKRTDEFGNAFRFWARVRGRDVGRWSVDVFLNIARITS